MSEEIRVDFAIGDLLLSANVQLRNFWLELEPRYENPFTYFHYHFNSLFPNGILQQQNATEQSLTSVVAPLFAKKTIICFLLNLVYFVSRSFGIL